MGAQSERSGAVQIDANMSGSNSLLTIGGNIGTINTRSKEGGGDEVSRVTSGIRITNGTEESTGGITVTSMDNLKVVNTMSRAGQIELNAQSGILTLPAGTLDVSGKDDEGAGFIFLLAKTIETENGTRIRADHTDNAPNVHHQVVIAAEKVKYQGAEGLRITSNGDGASSSLSTNIFVVPHKGVIPDSTDDINNLLWTRSFNGTFFSFEGEVNFESTDGAPLIISANGDNSRVAITGYPMKFSGGDLTIRSKGNGTVNDVVMGFFDTTKFDGTKGILFENNGTVQLDASGKSSNDDGGLVQVQSDLILMNAQKHQLWADGNKTGDSDGGEIVLTASNLNIAASATANVSADAASEGTGNAELSGRFGLGGVFIQIENSQTGVIDFGDQPGQMKVTANGGKNGGNGGLINVISAKVTGNTTQAINASARGGDGLGGTIALFGELDLNNNEKSTFKAVGQGQEQVEDSSFSLPNQTNYITLVEFLKLTMETTWIHLISVAK